MEMQYEVQPYSFVLFLTGDTRRGVLEWVKYLEMENFIQNYDHWWEVWSLQQSCPPGFRVGYLPFNGRHILGCVAK